MGQRLSSAAAEGNISEVAALLAQKADVNYSTPKGTALHEAARNGEVSILKLLLDAKGDANIGDATSDTPLHCAAYWGHANVAELLIQYNANINAAELTGDTALHEALKQGQMEVIRVLMKAAADINIPNLAGYTPLDLAKENGGPVVLGLLLKAEGIEIDADKCEFSGRLDDIVSELNDVMRERSKERPRKLANLIQATKEIIAATTDDPSKEHVCKRGLLLLERLMEEQRGAAVEDMLSRGQPTRLISISSNLQVPEEETLTPSA